MRKEERKEKGKRKMEKEKGREREGKEFSDYQQFIPIRGYVSPPKWEEDIILVECEKGGAF